MDDSKTDRGGFHKGSVPLKRALPLAESLRDDLAGMSVVAMIVGSVLRQSEIVGDIDLLILPKDLGSILEELRKHGWKGDDRIQRKMVDGILVEIYLAHSRKELGALQLYTTGDIAFVREMRATARDMDWELTQYGLFVRGFHTPVLQSPDEHDFFEALDIAWVPPEKRTLKEGSSPSLGDRHLPPMEWSPFWKRMTRPPGGKLLFPNVIWDFTPWRAPDYQDEGKSIWYGPEGKDGTEASVIMYQAGGWAFGEYKGVEGLIDNPPAPILSTFTFVSFEEMQKAGMEKSLVEVPLDAFQRSPDARSGFAAAVGAVKIAYYGGREEWVNELP